MKVWWKFGNESNDAEYATDEEKVINPTPFIFVFRNEWLVGRAKSWLAKFREEVMLAWLPELVTTGPLPSLTSKPSRAHCRNKQKPSLRRRQKHYKTIKTNSFTFCLAYCGSNCLRQYLARPAILNELRVQNSLRLGLFRSVVMHPTCFESALCGFVRPL